MESVQAQAKKPKVRTGCVTAKPSCTRCNSGGRICEGYSIPERKKHVFKKKANIRFWGDAENVAPAALRLLRPVDAGVHGTHDERLFFHRFEVSVNGLLLGSGTQRSAFWTRLLPQIAHSNEAVKHALMALSAGFRLMDFEKSQNGPEHEGQRTSDHFVLLQYNRSIQLLKRHTEKVTFENLEIILICCFVFVCLETARGNNEVMQIHLARGLDIIRNLVSTDFFLFCNIEESDVRVPRLERDARRQGFRPSRLSRGEWNQLLRYFGEYELGAYIYNKDSVPSISMRILELDDLLVAEVPEFRSQEDVSAAYTNWTFNVFALLHETEPYRGNAEWWSQSRQSHLYTKVLSWGRQLQQRVEEFMGGPQGPKSDGSIEYCKLLIDRAQGRSLLPAVEWMPFRYTRGQVFEGYEALQRQTVEDWEEIIRHFGSPDRVPDLFLGVTGIRAMMHCSMFHACDPDTRRRSREVVSFFKGKQMQMFHAATMLQLFDDNGVGEDDWLLPGQELFESGGSCWLIEDENRVPDPAESGYPGAGHNWVYESHFI
ncbi:hypothetical protein PFICI_13711 [Pestalotiopsis fici W106-1]|uniref:Zn(2)-C6 fungal-type domain-containing protein n=1 Tax=Pestalotiopsis fici (strain W106-1 / CGMCC3.15140) TaxID=1229662 RepID=W3WQ26_PESFW|nr:uncharacterized protein PFICI_13711 [Pestalotiopsis fici W106-1]ETS75227.1 hypothetical protein PFICI_13711 [Pestalotiopsis fici W106-1]